ncbi:UNVERIFIED_CONTAM: hypothetical protein Scaly_2251000 [Sesamum calycinum]|uniref:tRNA-uridine aminocarboxypropyltransferase n=1 Tax=Sesamum calycinum TaxID=2727403 RepID=A0AAW2M9T7_9LAMI
MGTKPFSSITPSTSPAEARRTTDAEATISLQEWQGWGTISPVPSMVKQVIQDLKLLEEDIDSEMTFDGNHGKLSGDFKVHEDKKHRAKYASLGNSEEKLQFFSARQIACRLLGSRGYLCQKCWLPREDCMCSKVTMCSLWHRLRIWLYMHPKDFLRQNNTGKLLWQVYGVQAASLCLFGIVEHEEMMWNELNHAGRNKVWCLYPNKNAATESVKDGVGCAVDPNPVSVETNELLYPGSSSLGKEGIWRRVTAGQMLFFARAGVGRLADSIPSAAIRYVTGITGESDNRTLIELNSMGAGTSLHISEHRPQPSWDRTCTAAAAIGLLYELQLVPEFSSCGLEKQAEAVDKALEVLLEALTARRLRMGRSISRRERHNRDIC